MNEREIDYVGWFRDSVSRGVSRQDAARDVIRRRYGTLDAAAVAAGVHKATLDLLLGGWRGGDKAAEARAKLAKEIGLPEEEFFGQGQEAA